MEGDIEMNDSQDQYKENHNGRELNRAPSLVSNTESTCQLVREDPGSAGKRKKLYLLVAAGLATVLVVGLSVGVTHGGGNIGEACPGTVIGMIPDD